MGKKKGKQPLSQKTMDEITKENKQTTQESSLEEQTTTMDEITEKNKQTTEERSLEEGNALSKFRRIPRWITKKNKIMSRSGNVRKVVVRILEKTKKCSGDDFKILLRSVHVNDISAGKGNINPMVVRIGPNKWDRDKPDIMGSVKLLYTSYFIERTNTNLEQFLRDNFKDINRPIKESKLTNNQSRLSEDELMEMFILDGCFIIELFLRNCSGKENFDKDVLFSSELLLVALSRDLLLLDNQLPFHFLQILFEKSGILEKLGQDDDGNHPNLIDLAFKFLKRILPTKKLEKSSVSDFHHDLRSLVYEGLSWLTLKASNNSNSNNDQDKKDGDDKWNSVKSATELRQFGVKFKMVHNVNFINIKFTNKGVLEIPYIRIGYGTAFSINMLLEVENDFFYNVKNLDQQRWLSDYLWLVNNLLKSPIDVQLLRQKNIIDNQSELRDDAAILKFLKDSCESLTIPPRNFSYRKICRDLNSHCIEHQPNFWLSRLRRDYFNTPWKIISFSAAFLLIILTIVQTVFSVASYYKDHGRI